jgi:hypothetical protein
MKTAIRKAQLWEEGCPLLINKYKSRYKLWQQVAALCNITMQVAMERERAETPSSQTQLQFPTTKNHHICFIFNLQSWGPWQVLHCIEIGVSMKIATL